ncbi:MAG: hypothetical protein A4E71_01900 [Smithella sp. PtaU1.Bin162]|nr:MAG: hypothetical protein A4E71_01900 [Smithella sp. PtaU1.Bin162]
MRPTQKAGRLCYAGTEEMKKREEKVIRIAEKKRLLCPAIIACRISDWGRI